jgi:hypothetical protein
VQARVGREDGGAGAAHVHRVQARHDRRRRLRAELRKKIC